MVSQVGWIKFDGDEHHDFTYWSPEDPRRLAWISAQGFLPVYVPDTLDEDLAILALSPEDLRRLILDGVRGPCRCRLCVEVRRRARVLAWPKHDDDWPEIEEEAHDFRPEDSDG